MDEGDDKKDQGRRPGDKAVIPMPTATDMRPVHPPGSTSSTPAWLRRGPGRQNLNEQEDLGRALVAGLILEVVLDAASLPVEPRSRRRQVKSRLKDTLVSRLAGHIPLSSFLNLVQKVDLWFDTYYPLITPGDHTDTAPSPVHTEPAPWAGGLAEDLLSPFLDSLSPLLPQRRHRKLSRAGLLEFLRHTGGKWFRLRDFQEFFHLDRKTAWEYVQKLSVAGLFRRNEGRSAAVRYRLDAKFLQTSAP
jgi:hypothetical protein